MVVGVQHYAPAALPAVKNSSGRNAGTHRTGGRKCRRADLDVFEKREMLPLPGFEHRTVQPEAQSLYRLRYPSSQLQMVPVNISTYISPAVVVNTGKKPLYILRRITSDPLSSTSCVCITISQFCSSYLNYGLFYGGWLRLTSKRAASISLYLRH